MDQFRVELTVDMNADSPEDAATYVAEMAEGWTYIVTNFITDRRYEVYLEAGKDPEVKEISR